MSTISTPGNFVPPLPSPSISENVFANPAGDPSLTEVQGALAACRSAVENARAGALALLANEMYSTGAKHVAADDFAFKCLRPALAATDRVAQRLAGEIRSLETKTAVPSPPRDVLAAEVRSRLSQMTPGARSKAVATSINDGDDILVAALLSGPAMLSGATQAEVDHAREQWRRARLPDDCRRLDELRKAQVHLQRAGALTLAYQSKCSDPSIIAAAKESQRKADAAVAAANAALMH